MTPLPIVARELRVAARRPMSYWGRIVAGGAFVILATFALFVAAVSGMRPSGLALFKGLAHIAFIVCAVAGPLLAADVLSGEKRQGTLGLLFLTDLRPLDIVLGKLAAVLINAASAVLASLPVLAISVLMGGVSMDRLGGLALALLNTLLFSMACTVVVSAFCTESRSSLALSAFLLLLFIFVIPALARTATTGISRVALVTLTLASPTGPYLEVATDQRPSPYLSDPGYLWQVGIGIGFSSLLLLFSAFVTKMAWRESRVRALPQRLWQWTAGWMFGAGERRSELRAALLDRNPWTWLGSRNRLKQRLLWATVVPILPMWTAIGWLRGNPWDAALTLTLAYVVQLFLKVLIASEASYLFAETRRSGAFELLLTTPLSGRQITQGHVATMRRLFTPPALVTALTANLVVATELSAAEQAVVAATTLLLLWDLHAIAWVGMWRGLRQRRPHLASLNTLLRVLVWPSMALAFLSVISVAASPYGPLVMAITVFAASNTLQTSIASDLLNANLRSVVAKQFQSDRAEAS